MGCARTGQNSLTEVKSNECGEEKGSALREALKSVLVTGANGFIGRNLIELLCSRKWKVIAVLRREPGALARPGVQFEQLTLSKEPERWQSALRSVDCVVHLAGRAHKLGRAGEDAEAFNEVNVLGASFVARQAVAAGVKRFIMLSSIKVNGEGGPSVVYRAEDVPNPEDAYGRSKLAAEIAIREICTRGGVEYVVLRPPLVYGPGVGANFRRLMRLVELGIPLPFGSIDNRRSLIGIRNLMDFIETSMAHSGAAGKTWLISDGEDLSTPELASKLAKLMFRRPAFFPFPPRLLRFAASCLGRRDEMERLTGSLQLDINPAAAYLNWHPPVSVDDGLAETVATYKRGG
jgi:nucleoside-diphosphate-sugar epimerase